jgi:hypothetical protein
LLKTAKSFIIGGGRGGGGFVPYSKINILQQDYLQFLKAEYCFCPGKQIFCMKLLLLMEVFLAFTTGGLACQT